LNHGKQAKKDRLDYHLHKYMNRYGLLIGSGDKTAERATADDLNYPALELTTKLRLVKCLLESQFDDNQKLKQSLTETLGTDLSSLRSLPMGRDKNALTYWLYMDAEFSLRVYTQQAGDVEGKSWTLVAASLDELKQLVEKIAAEPSLARLKTCNFDFF
jgi:hypothetical protein